MLSDTQRAAYDRDGVIVVPDVFSAAEIAELRRVTDGFVERAARVGANDEIYDLEDSHSAAEPRVRRLKTPHLHDPAYFRASRNDKVVAILKDLWGSVRFDTGKLNMKSAGLWRARRMAPGLGLLSAHQRRSRRGRDHARRCRYGERPDAGCARAAIRARSGIITGRTAGSAARSTRPNCGLDLSRALPCLGKAGSVTVHHVRAVHGSATNFSGRERRFLLLSIPRRRRLAAPRLQGRRREIQRIAARRRADHRAAPRGGAGAPAIAAGRVSGLDLREPARQRPPLFRTAAREKKRRNKTGPYPLAVIPAKAGTHSFRFSCR